MKYLKKFNESWFSSLMKPKNRPKMPSYYEYFFKPRILEGKESIINKYSKDDIGNILQELSDDFNIDVTYGCINEVVIYKKSMLDDDMDITVYSAFNNKDLLFMYYTMDKNKCNCYEIKMLDKAYSDDDINEIKDLLASKSNLFGFEYMLSNYISSNYGNETKWRILIY